ncbi:bifunctional folylpolyglutamate synthase/dihydrofolate synthase [Candidatus Woesearchaeota archaeon]|nr:bifunctional folylpolyglutamate synthase/dihydrofolate synthase [Candidatus Woesearchaeota archaeon]
MALTNYNEVLKYLDKLELFGIKLGLENISRLCEILGNPQDEYKTIHVAGTNGKGSVVAMCSFILKEAGYKAGMYTSPHLQSFRERMQVNGEWISENEVVEVFDEVKAAADKMKAAGMQATYFEFTTAMAFLHFKKRNCDFAVIETGMGGRLDATNIVKPLVAVITNIELEHTQYLGDTKEKIAAEKAGIIKEGSAAVIGEKDAQIQQQLLKICGSRNAKATVVEKDYEGRISLLGEHQKRNAAVAAAAITNLGKAGIKISSSDIRNGIEKTKWPGRLEVMQEKPRVILDAAHNPSGALTVADYIKSQKNGIVLVIGISSDKDTAKMIQILAPLAKKVLVTKAKHRGSDCELLRKEAKKHNKSAEAIEDVKEAVRKALKEAEGSTIMVTGSIFVIGEARGLWHDIPE